MSRIRQRDSDAQSNPNRLSYTTPSALPDILDRVRNSIPTAAAYFIALNDNATAEFAAWVGAWNQLYPEVLLSGDQEYLGALVGDYTSMFVGHILDMSVDVLHDSVYDATPITCIMAAPLDRVSSVAPYGDPHRVYGRLTYDIAHFVVSLCSDGIRSGAVNTGHRITDALNNPGIVLSAVRDQWFEWSRAEYVRRCIEARELHAHTNARLVNIVLDDDDEELNAPAPDALGLRPDMHDQDETTPQTAFRAVMSLNVPPDGQEDREVRPRQYTSSHITEMYEWHAQHMEWWNDNTSPDSDVSLYVSVLVDEDISACLYQALELLNQDKVRTTLRRLKGLFLTIKLMYMQRATVMLPNPTSGRATLLSHVTPREDVGVEELFDLATDEFSNTAERPDIIDEYISVLRTCHIPLAVGIGIIRMINKCRWYARRPLYRITMDWERTQTVKLVEDPRVTLGMWPRRYDEMPLTELATYCTEIMPVIGGTYQRYYDAVSEYGEHASDWVRSAGTMDGSVWVQQMVTRGMITPIRSDALQRLQNVIRNAGVNDMMSDAELEAAYTVVDSASASEVRAEEESKKDAGMLEDSSDEQE